MEVNPDELAVVIEQELRRVGTPERAAREKSYLKSELEFLGATVPQIQRAVRDALAGCGDLDRDAVVALARSLWTAPLHERRFAAVQVLERYVDRLDSSDVPLLERFLREAKTWAYADGLAVSVVGVLCEREPQALASTLDRWAADDDFWLRRAALLALLPGLRRGAGDFDRFAGYAEAMLAEQEFFIRKAIGWVLRETAKLRPELVFSWLRPRIARASGVTVREAVKYLPDEQRVELLEAYGAARRR